jgi:HK97 family phage major capsid protein
METNREIAARTAIQKADLVIGDMTTNGGALLPAQSKQFFEISTEDKVLMQEVAMPPLSAQVQEVDGIGFLSRIVRGGAEGRALSLADRSAPSFVKPTFTTKEFKAQVNLTYQDLEDNIEGDQLQQRIIRMAAERFGLDLEDAVINGDTASTDPLLSRMDGILKKATTHVVDDGVIVHAQTHYLHALQALPSQFQKNKANMRFYTAPTIELKWRDLNASRTGALADSAIISSNPIPAYGIKVVSVPMFPTALGTGTNESNILLTDPKNIGVGFWKTVTVKTQEDIQSGVIMIVARARVDVQYFYEPAVVKVVKVKAA